MKARCSVTAAKQKGSACSPRPTPNNLPSLQMKKQQAAFCDGSETRTFDTHPLQNFPRSCLSIQLIFLLQPVKDAFPGMHTTTDTASPFSQCPPRVPTHAGPGHPAHRSHRAVGSEGTSKPSWLQPHVIPECLPQQQHKPSCQTGLFKEEGLSLAELTLLPMVSKKVMEQKKKEKPPTPECPPRSSF